MRFPKKVTFGKRGKATIYGKKNGYPFYRVCGYLDGKRRMESHRTYSAALAAADALARAVNGQKDDQPDTTTLTKGEANDAKAALGVLSALRQGKGITVSLYAAAKEYAEAIGKLPRDLNPDGQVVLKVSLLAAVDNYVANFATVKRLDLAAAVEEFIASREPLTKAGKGKRAQLSAGYFYNQSMWQREFAATFPGHAVCDLTKEHLHQYFAAHGSVSPRTRNARRQAVGIFMKWAVGRDYLAANHRLLAADAMRKEVEDLGEIQFHTPAELRAMLDAATGDRAHLLPIVAICALAGLRLEEAVRLTWEDVFRVEGHIEVTGSKSKTRARRLVTVCPALAQWLAPYRDRTGPLWAHRLERWHVEFNDLRTSLGIPIKRNALRHAFCSYHYALHGNESLTAQQAGNSPQMLHQHYKGLATKGEAEQWFAVAPSAPANVIPLAQAVA